MPVDKGTTLPITQLSGLQLNYKDSNSCFNLPIMTTAERDALVNTNDPTNPIKNGTMIFNSDTNFIQYYQITSTSKNWIDVKPGMGAGDVVGPSSSVTGHLASFSDDTGKEIKDSGVSTNLVVSASSASVKKGQIPVWYNTTEGKISIANSGLQASQLKPTNARKNVNESELYLLSNLGALQFGNSENVADTGVILLDGLTPVTFQMQGTGANSRVCTVINGEIGEGSSSPSAILEINSTVGAFLNARLNMVQRDALVDPVDGMLIFNTESKTIESRQGGKWVSLGGGGGGSGTVTSVGLTNTDGRLNISNSPINSSGSINVNFADNLGIIGVNIIDLHQNINFVRSTFNYPVGIPSSVTSGVQFIFPGSNGAKGQVLSTDGAGNTSWVNNGGGGSPTNSYYLLTKADSSLPNATILPVINTPPSPNKNGNLYIGYYSGTNSTNADANTGIGYQTLNALTGSSLANVAVGSQVLSEAQNSIANIGIGTQVMFGLTTDNTSNNNIGIGFQALCNLNTNSSNNVAVGYQALSKLTNNSSNNVVAGYNSGNKQTEYQSCTFLGANTDCSAVNPLYATAIGADTVVNSNHAYVIGSERTNFPVGIGTSTPKYSLDIANTLSPSGLSESCTIKLQSSQNYGSPPSGTDDIVLWASHGNSYGALFMTNSKGSVYKFDSTNISAPASEPKIPVLTAEEIQNLQDIALGAIVYDSTNDTVIISTKSGWQNLTRSLYNPQSVSAGI